jgi:nucleoid-associated protein YgaU
MSILLVTQVNPRKYHMQRGDTLWSVAQKFYGDGNRWKQIYEVNKSTFSSGPNLIQPGIILWIPW